MSWQLLVRKGLKLITFFKEYAWLPLPKCFEIVNHLDWIRVKELKLNLDERCFWLEGISACTGKDCILTYKTRFIV